jgi:hypothetical protein
MQSTPSSADLASWASTKPSWGQPLVCLRANPLDAVQLTLEPVHEAAHVPALARQPGDQGTGIGRDVLPVAEPTGRVVEEVGVLVEGHELNLFRWG